jgi:hypothetical protein
MLSKRGKMHPMIGAVFIQNATSGGSQYSARERCNWLGYWSVWILPGHLMTDMEILDDPPFVGVSPGAVSS